MGRRRAAARGAPKARKARNRGASTADLQKQVATLSRELNAAREQQTATTAVLKVISSSVVELEPVFKALLANATRLCEANYGGMWLCEGDAFRAATVYGAMPAEFVDRWRSGTLFQPSPNLPMVRAIKTRRPVNVDDLRASKAYREGHPIPVVGVDTAGIRSMVAMPMFKDDQPIGVFSIYRKEVRPFGEKHIELLANFASQAAVAIENTRLLNELRQSLEQQTATADVLRVISSSPGELDTVFKEMLEKATRICEANFGTLWLCEGSGFRCVALHNAPPKYAEERRKNPVIRPRPATTLGRLVATKQPVQIADVMNEPHYFDVPSGYSSPQVPKLAGARTLVGVPMLKDNELVGAINIYRKEARPFTDKQIELLTNFAAQAVIAIDNSRLLSDLNKLNQQLEQRVTDQVSEIERMSRLRRFLSPQVADLIIASGMEKQLESHRREITALFCDLRGFTGFSEKSDPEDVMSLLREYHAAIGAIIKIGRAHV